MTRADEPAFPVVHIDESGWRGSARAASGMTLREYYAGLAMQGLLGNSEYMAGCGGEPKYMHMAAIDSVAYADALLAELEKAR